MFIALVIQHAKRMRRILLSSVACPVHFQFFSQTARISRKRKLFKIKCVLIFSTFARNICHFKKNWSRCYHKCTYVLSDFNETWIFSTDFWKILKYQFSWRYEQWEPICLTRTDRHGETDSRFSQFRERKVEYYTACICYWNYPQKLQSKYKYSFTQSTKLEHKSQYEVPRISYSDYYRRLVPKPCWGHLV